MSLPPTPDRRTPEEKAIANAEWISDHYLVEGKRYTFEVAQHWMSEKWNRKVYRWTCYIKEAESPWSIIACETGFKNKRRATKWGKDYLERGGPPENFFGPLSPDPNEIIYKRSS